MPTPDKEARSGEIKLAAMEAALKDEVATWMPEGQAEGRLSANAAALVGVLEALLNNYVAAHSISVSAVLGAGMAFFGGLLVQAAMLNDWTRAEEETVRQWAAASLAELPLVSERDEDL